jgi:hypothetical protein
MGTTRSVSEVGPTLDAPVRTVGRATAGRWLERVLWLVVVAFGAAIGVGIVETLWALVHLAHPDPGFGYLVYDDALQIYSGHWPWQDPATGYVGLIYPPGFSGLVAALLHIRLWSGWSVLVSILSSLVLATMVASMAYRRGGPAVPAARMLEAAAIGLVGWWLVTCTPHPGLDGRSDTTAWALALGGLLLVPRALTGSRSAMVAPVALLSLGLLTKQHAAGAMVAAGIWAALACIAGVTTWRRAVAFVASLAVVNLITFGMLYVASDGWIYTYVVELPRHHHWGNMPLEKLLERVGQILWLPVSFTAVMLASGAWARGRGALRRRSALVRDRGVQQLVLLGLFVVIATPVAVYSEQKQGADDNHLVGPLWGLALLAALGWRVSGRRSASRIVTGLAVAMLGLLGLGFGHAVTFEETIWAGGMNRIRNIVTVTHLPEVPKSSLAAAQGHTLYDWHHSDLGMRDGHVPSSLTICDLTAGGLSPVAVEQAIAARRYDLIQLAPITKPAACSGYGKWEEYYFWKLNSLIEAGYQANPRRFSPEILERRPGAASAVATRKLLRCFAPYRLGGVLFRIGKGGGFWCQPTPTDPRVTLHKIPSDISEILSDGVVTSVKGSLVVTLPAGTGTVVVGVDSGGGLQPFAQLSADAARTTRTVVTFSSSRGSATNATATNQRLDPAAFAGGHFAIIATANSQVRLDFSGMTLRTKDGVLRGAVTRRGLPGAGDP